MLIEIRLLIIIVTVFAFQHEQRIVLALLPENLHVDIVIGQLPAAAEHVISATQPADLVQGLSIQQYEANDGLVVVEVDTFGHLA